LRAENFAIAGLHLVYGLALLVFAQPYFGEVIGTALQSLGGYDLPLRAFVWNRHVLALGVALAAGFALRPSGPRRELQQVLWVAAGALWVVALLQRRGWIYHFLPLALAAACSLAFSGAEALTRGSHARGMARRRRGGLVLGGVALLAWAATALARPLWSPGVSPRATSLERLAAVAREHAAGQPVLFLSTSVWPAYPIVNVSGARSTSRFSCLWPLVGFYRASGPARRPFPYHAPEEMNSLERGFLDDFIEDLERRPPALIFLDRSRKKQGIGRSSFNYLEYFRRDPRFAQAFGEFEFQVDVSSYRVFRRRDR
jgi:hypothetical protein